MKHCFLRVRSLHQRPTEVFSDLDLSTSDNERFVEKSGYGYLRRVRCSESAFTTVAIPGDADAVETQNKAG